jgi:uncharacterized protein (TIGR00255 family)
VSSKTVKDCLLLTAHCSPPYCSLVMKSMTGFGRGTAAGENFTVSVDLKTVNNRFLDIHLRAGAELASIESLIRRRISDGLSRGRVDAVVTLERTDEIKYELNRPLINGYIGALRALQQEFALSGEPDVNVLARLPGVMQAARDGLSEEVIRGVESAIMESLADLNRMRAREGEVLSAEMSARLDKIEGQIPTLEAMASDQLDAYRARLRRRISEMLARDGYESIELDQGRLAQEVAYLADRSDITEEIARLKSHLTQFRDSLGGEGETGKRLDFLLQELNREANTVLSKSTDMVIKEAALAIKAEVEKLREQVQNVE